MSQALITGVAGFTGKYLAEALAAHGHRVSGIGIEPRPDSVPLDDYRRADMLDADALKDAVAALRPDFVFHLAGISHVAHGSADAIYRVNIVASRNLLTALAALEIPPKRVLLASTANLYGNQEGVLTEQTPPAPMNDYAVSKLAMEYMASLFKSRLPITIVRPFNYTGRGQSPAFLIPKLVQHFKERRPFIELGNTDVVRDFSDVRDVADCYVRLAEAENAGWGPYNFCSGRGLSIGDILSQLHEMTEHSIEMRINPAFVRQNEVKHLIGSRERLEGAVGHISSIPFRDTLRWMLDE